LLLQSGNSTSGTKDSRSGGEGEDDVWLVRMRMKMRVRMDEKRTEIFLEPVRVRDLG
jgi:hypothetical protein